LRKGALLPVWMAKLLSHWSHLDLFRTPSRAREIFELGPRYLAIWKSFWPRNNNRNDI